MKQLELESSKPDSLVRNAVDTKQKEFEELIRDIEQVLKQLDGLVSKYQSLCTGNRRKRDVLRFSAEGLEEIRSKIILHTSAAILFLGTLSAASLGRIELKLDEIVNELRSGQRDTAAIALSDDEDDPVARKRWRTLKNELVNDGFQQEDIESHKAWIKAELRKRIPEGQSEQEKDKETRKPYGLPYQITNMDYKQNRWHSPQFTNPWLTSPLPLRSMGKQATLEEMSNFADALDASRGMVAMSQSDITPRYIYGSAGSNAENPPKLRRSPSITSIDSTHSDVAEYDMYGNVTKRTVITTTTTYYSTSASGGSVSGGYGSTDFSDHDVPSRTLPRPNGSLSMPPAPQSMIGQFASKISSSSAKKHKCKICDKRFTRESSLQTHMYSHTGEKRKS